MRRAPHSDDADSPVDPASAGSPEPADAVLRPSRRALFTAVGAGAAGLAIGATGGALAASAASGTKGATSTGSVAFEGAHQAGIVTPAQDHLHFAAFDLLRSAGREQLIALLQEWTEAARRLVRGEDLGDGAVDGAPLAPPDDTGEAHGLAASNLTLTFGLGRALFADRATGTSGATPIADPFGLRDRMPAEFEPLPSFAFDLLQEAVSGGDLCIQACADDPQVAVHAIRNLTRIAMGTAHLRWSQLGFGRTSSTSHEQQTPRNLFGFKDGTANIMAEDTAALRESVWVGDDAPAWLRGGSYLVTRKIAMTIETWDRSSLSEQERIIGRSKGEGGPLSGGAEFDAPDFAAVHTSGGTAIDRDAHVALAHPDRNDGMRMLRRGYNYVDGSNDLGQLGAGLFFIAYQSDPAVFVRVQNSLKSDLMNEYIRHIGSGLWAVPGGVGPGEYLAQRLFD